MVNDGDYTIPELPKPARFATYNGNRANMMGGIYGPNQLGELMTVVEVKHDPETHTSRVGFAFATVPAIRGAFLAEGSIEIASSARAQAARAMVAATKAGV